MAKMNDKTCKLFKQAVDVGIIGDDCGMETAVTDRYAAIQLSTAVEALMQGSLEAARHQGDRGGWWNAQLCPLERLYQLREKAMADNDHISIINYTAMIIAREEAAKHARLDNAASGTAAREEDV